MEEEAAEAAAAASQHANLPLYRRMALARQSAAAAGSAATGFVKASAVRCPEEVTGSARTHGSTSNKPCGASSSSSFSGGGVARRVGSGTTGAATAASDRGTGCGGDGGSERAAASVGVSTNGSGPGDIGGGPDSGKKRDKKRDRGEDDGGGPSVRGHGVKSPWQGGASGSSRAAAVSADGDGDDSDVVEVVPVTRRAGKTPADVAGTGGGAGAVAASRPPRHVGVSTTALTGDAVRAVTSIVDVPLLMLLPATSHRDDAVKRCVWASALCVSLGCYQPVSQSRSAPCGCSVVVNALLLNLARFCPPASTCHGSK